MGEKSRFVHFFYIFWTIFGRFFHPYGEFFHLVVEIRSYLCIVVITMILGFFLRYHKARRYREGATYLREEVGGA